MSSPNLLFFRKFLKAPAKVGSIIPTARATIDALLNPVDWQPVDCVVEYGPGTGVFTRAILERLGSEARLFAIDTDADFIAYLHATISDSRLTCVLGSAANVNAILTKHGKMSADYVVSGLPFSTLPEGVADDIMAATARAIRPGGTFLVYQYSDFVLPFLRRHFTTVAVRRAWRCIPPAKLFWARKASVSGLTAEVEPAGHRVVQHAHDLIGEPPGN